MSAALVVVLVLWTVFGASATMWAYLEDKKPSRIVLSFFTWPAGVARAIAKAEREGRP